MNATAEHEQFLPSKRLHGGASPRSSDSRQHWSLWLPLAALFGALCTLALVSSLGSSGGSQQLRWVLRGGELSLCTSRILLSDHAAPAVCSLALPRCRRCRQPTSNRPCIFIVRRH